MPETETIEFKKSLAELNEGLVSMVAMLNKHGHGELWFGIKNDGTPVGMDVSDTTLRKVSQAIAAHIEPKLYPEVTSETLQGKNCIRIAYSGHDGPYFAHGRAYMRVSDEDRKLSARELENIILQKNRSYQGWDAEPSTAKINEIDPARVSRFLKRAGLPDTQPREALEKLDLLRNKKPLNAARLFFLAKNQHRLRCALFAGSTSATILDQHDFEGDILTLIEDAQRYILQNIHIGMRVEGLERVEVPEIHPEAIREAIINAFCHRDYRDPDDVQIAIFKDRIEIRNPGGLLEGMRMEDLMRGNFSRRRNPIVAELLRRVKLVEAWGRGIPLILERAPQVRFEEKAGLFITTLPRPPETQTPVKKGGETPIKTPEKMSEKMSEKTSEKTSEKIVYAIQQNSTLTIAELATAIGVTTRTIERNLFKLQENKRIRRVGPDKGGHWEVLDQ